MISKINAFTLSKKILFHLLEKTAPPGDMIILRIWGAKEKYFQGVEEFSCRDLGRSALFSGIKGAQIPLGGWGLNIVRPYKGQAGLPVDPNMATDTWGQQSFWIRTLFNSKYEPRHEIFNNMVCAISKTSDQPSHTRSLIRAYASRLNIL